MDDNIVFSEHSILRISERTNLSPQDIQIRLTQQIAVLVKETAFKPFRYQVLWDSSKSKPLLVILRKLSEALWEVVTVYETMTYHKRADDVMVLPRHIDKARKREVRYINEGHPEGGAWRSAGHVRLHVIVRFCEYGKPKSRRHKIGSVPIHEFLSTHGGKAENLLRHFIQLGKMDYVPVLVDSVIEAEVLTTKENTRTVLSSWQ